MLRALNGGHFKIFKYQTQLQLDLKYEAIVPNCVKNIFHDYDGIDDVTECPQSFPL